MQWVGGLGIVVLSMAILIQPGLTAKRLDITDSFDDDIIGGTRAIARYTLIIYSLLTLTGILLLLLLGTDFFSSVLYALAAVSTGGFSPHDASLQGLDSGYARAVVIGFSMAGAVSLIVYYRVFHRRWRDAVSDQQIQAFFITAIIITALLSCFLWYQEGLAPLKALTHGALNGLSALSTAGFSSLPVGDMENGTKLILMVSMATGGGVPGPRLEASRSSGS
jgi:trk system potassium uptake protein TrkH